jgi:hypothetical protein
MKTRHRSHAKRSPRSNEEPAQLCLGGGHESAGGPPETLW